LTAGTRPKRINSDERDFACGLFKKKSMAVSRTLALVMILALVVALIAGEYFITSKSNGGSTEVDITIVEDNPVLQLDHFYPDNVTVALGQNVTLAILNGDDELRVFTLTQFGINESMAPGTAVRVTFVANHAGDFLFYSPKTPPSAVSQGRPGPYLSGNFTVT